MTVTTALKEPKYDEYVPGPVDPNVEIEGLRTYTVEEFNRLAEYLRQNRQLPAFTGGYRTAATSGFTVNNVTPTLLPLLTTLSAAGEQGMIWNLGTHRMTMNKVRGVVYIAATITAEVDTLTNYIVEAYLDGAATGVRAVLDISNQETWGTLHLEGVTLLQEGSYIELFGSSDKASSTFELINCTFTAYRIG